MNACLRLFRGCGRFVCLAGLSVLPLRAGVDLPPVILDHGAGATAFRAGFGPFLEALEPGTIAGWRRELAARMEDPSLPTGRAQEALALTDAHWACLDPAAFLREMTGNPRPASVGTQLLALDRLMAKDIEAAIRAYQNIPLYGDLGGHRAFYQRLAAVDPNRAVRLFFESPDHERLFDKGLDACFEAWARRDPAAAWSAAGALEDTGWVRQARQKVVETVLRTGGRDQAARLIASLGENEERRLLEAHLKLPDSPAGSTAVDAPDNPRASEVLLRKLRQIPYHEYAKDKPFPLHDVTRMIGHFPERSWPWVRKIDPLNGAFGFYVHQTAQAWPKDRFEEDMHEFLMADESPEQALGLHMAGIFMRANPGQAMPALFNRYPQHATDLAGKVMISSWIEERIISLEELQTAIGKITDPSARTRLQEQQVAWQMREAPAGKAVALLSSLQEPRLRKMAIQLLAERCIGRGMMITGGPSNTPATGPVFLRSLLAVRGGHVAVRDEVLASIPARMLDAGRADVSLLPDILGTIETPRFRRKALTHLKSASLLGPLDARLLTAVAAYPPGRVQREHLRHIIRQVPNADLIALGRQPAGRTPQWHRDILLSLDSSRLKPDEVAACLEWLDSLPEAWKDEELINRWWLLQARFKPPGDWAHLIREFQPEPEFPRRFEEVMGAWLKQDPRAFSGAILGSGREPDWPSFAAMAVEARHPGDRRAVFRDLCSRPEWRNQALLAWFEELVAAGEFQQAVAMSLLISRDSVRASALAQTWNRWRERERQAAIDWCLHLPPGPDRGELLASHARKLVSVGAAIPDWLVDALPAEDRPDKRTTPSGRSSTRASAKDHPTETARRQANEERRNTIASIRALAALDEPATMASVRKLPAGPHKTDSLLGLLGHAAATGNDRLFRAMMGDLEKTHPRLETMTAAAQAVMQGLPLTQLRQAIEFAASRKSPTEREAAGRILLQRWTAAEYRPEILGWIRREPDPESRRSLAQDYLRHCHGLADPGQPPAAAADPPDLEPALRQCLAIHSRRMLAASMIDGHPPWDLWSSEAGLDPDQLREVERVIHESQTLHQQAAP